VSKGTATTQVPDVRNQNQSTAESLLTGAGLTPSVVYQPVNDPSQDGIVLDQNPAPGADAKSGEIVIITVGQLQNGSTGPAGTTTTTGQ
jgi:beta-lactam-binding protein with PASTA domain